MLLRNAGLACLLLKDTPLKTVNINVKRTVEINYAPPTKSRSILT
jgi:hypothetical protein